MTHSNQDLSIQPAITSLSEKAPIPYTVVRSRRKTMVIHVKHLAVEVRVPFFVTKKQIDGFVSDHEQWVLNMLEHKAEQETQKPHLVDGGSIFYKGKRLGVAVIKASRDEVTLSEGQLCIALRKPDEAGAAKALQRWLQIEAKRYLPERTQALAHHLGLGEKFQEVVFRKTKTKWGHCTVDGRIQYNWLIMMAPDAVIDYMICHEVCHLRHMNHSKHFWSLVASVCPDYRLYQSWLKKHEHRLWI
jgi:predicted metal-dependent hydrolase